MNTTVYVILTIVKAVGIIIGMIYSFLNFWSWRKNKYSNKLKKALILFGGVILWIVIISGVEIIIAFY
jgi:heme A synthase